MAGRIVYISKILFDCLFVLSLNVPVNNTRWDAAFWDAAERGVPSGTILFAQRIFIKTEIKIEKAYLMMPLK